MVNPYEAGSAIRTVEAGVQKVAPEIAAAWAEAASNIYVKAQGSLPDAVKAFFPWIKPHEIINAASNAEAIAAVKELAGQSSKGTFHDWMNGLAATYKKYPDNATAAMLETNLLLEGRGYRLQRHWLRPPERAYLQSVREFEHPVAQVLATHEKLAYWRKGPPLSLGQEALLHGFRTQPFDVGSARLAAHSYLLNHPSKLARTS